MVKSLDAGEKRYFRLRQNLYQKADGSLFQQLFTLLEQQATYDEAAIRKQLCADRPDRQLHVLKNHLYHQLLEALIAYRGEKQVADRLQLLIRKAQLLQEKSLYREASRFFERAAELAEKLDQFEQLLTIYKHWKRLYAWILEVDKRAEHIARFWKKEQEALEKLANLRELEWASMRVFDLYYRIHYARSDEQKQQYHELMEHPLLAEADRALCFSARVVFLNTHGLYEDAVGHPERCLLFRQQLVALYEGRPDLLRESFSQYLAAFNNYVLGLIHQSQNTEAQSALDQLASLPTQIPLHRKTPEHIMWFRALYSLRLELFIRTGDFVAARDMIPDTERQFETLGKALNPAFRFPFRYFFAYTHFALGQYDAALGFLAPLLPEVELLFKQELFRFARLLQLIIHYEKGDFVLLPSLYRSSRRYLQKLGGTFVLEDRLLKFLNKAPHADSRQAFQELRQDLVAAGAEVLNAQVLHHFHFLAWIDSHLKKTSFADIYQEFKKMAQL